MSHTVRLTKGLPQVVMVGRRKYSTGSLNCNDFVVMKLGLPLLILRRGDRLGLLSYNQALPPTARLRNGHAARPDLRAWHSASSNGGTTIVRARGYPEGNYTNELQLAAAIRDYNAGWATTTRLMRRPGTTPEDMDKGTANNTYVTNVLDIASHCFNR